MCVGSRTQATDKVNVWLGLMGDQIVGPYFFLSNVNGPDYLRMLEEKLLPHLNEIGHPIFFQQDGAPAHYTTPVRHWLDCWFPNRWIGRSGPIPWPARSPDLTPLDYFLWGYLKHKVYQHEIEDVNQLIVIKIKFFAFSFLFNGLFMC